MLTRPRAVFSESREIRSQLASAVERGQQYDRLASTLKIELAQSATELRAAQERAARTDSDLESLKKVVGEHVDNRQRTERLAQVQEAEIADLKARLAAASSEAALARREQESQSQSARCETDRLRNEATTARASARQLEEETKRQKALIAKLQVDNDAHIQARQSHDLALELVRTQEAERALKERQKYEEQFASLRSEVQRFEDDAVVAQRERDAIMREADSLRQQLAAEQAASDAHALERSRLDEQVVQQHLVLADLDKINGDLRAELASKSARLVVAEERASRTVVSRTEACLACGLRVVLITSCPRRSSISVCSRRLKGSRPSPQSLNVWLFPLTQELVQAAERGDGQNAGRS